MLSATKSCFASIVPDVITKRLQFNNTIIYNRTPHLPGKDSDQFKLNILWLQAQLYSFKVLSIPVMTVFIGIDLGKKTDFTVVVLQSHLTASV